MATIEINNSDWTEITLTGDTYAICIQSPSSSSNKYTALVQNSPSKPADTNNYGFMISPAINVTFAKSSADKAWARLPSTNAAAVTLYYEES